MMLSDAYFLKQPDRRPSHTAKFKCLYCGKDDCSNKHTPEDHDVDYIPLLGGPGNSKTASEEHEHALKAGKARA